MRRWAVPLAGFFGGWVATTVALFPLYKPEVVYDYVRVFVVGGYAGVAVLVGLVTVYHWRAYRNARHMFAPHLVWGMGGSYLIAAGGVAATILEHIGDPITYRPVLLSVSLVLALGWLFPLLAALRRRA